MMKRNTPLMRTPVTYPRSTSGDLIIDERQVDFTDERTLASIRGKTVILLSPGLRFSFLRRLNFKLRSHRLGTALLPISVAEAVEMSLPAGPGSDSEREL